jgi:hypothetical protein
MAINVFSETADEHHRIARTVRWRFVHGAWSSSEDDRYDKLCLRQGDKQQLTQQTAAAVDFPSLKIFTLSIKVTVTNAQTNAAITWSVLIPHG